MTYKGLLHHYEGGQLLSLLVTPPHPSTKPTKNAKSCGRVLTSYEYIEQMEEKERMKLEEIRVKEQRKKETIDRRQPRKLRN